MGREKALNRIARRCLTIHIGHGITGMHRSYIHDMNVISRHWREMKEAVTIEDKQKSAADIIMDSLSFLSKSGVTDIDGFLSRRVEEHRTG